MISGSMPDRVFDFNADHPQSYEGGPCSEIMCRIRFGGMTKAMFYCRGTGGWVCLQCAQAKNKVALQRNRPKECISAKERTFELLSNQRA